MSVPPFVLDLVAALPDSVQEKLITIAGRAAMDPWFLALATIPYLVNLTYLPHWVKVTVLAGALGPKYNNRLPRHMDVDENVPKYSNFVKRCISCHQNSFEFLVGCAPAILMAKVNKADGKVVRDLCLRVIAARTAYFFLYLAGTNDLIALGRTISWTIGMSSMAQIYAAALQL